jgi:hypothetical protein
LATMTLRDTDGAREFRVPFTETLAGAPFKGPGELVLETSGMMARPTRLALHFHPTALEFQARLPGLVRGGPLEASLFDFGEAGSKHPPVVVFEGDSTVLSRVPMRLVNLELLERFLASGKDLFDFAHYRFASVDFQMGKTQE